MVCLIYAKKIVIALDPSMQHFYTNKVLYYISNFQITQIPFKRYIKYQNLKMLIDLEPSQIKLNKYKTLATLFHLIRHEILVFSFLKDSKSLPLSFLHHLKIALLLS